MQTKPNRMPIWLILLYILSLATILVWPFVAYMSVFAFDAPGSAQDPRVWTGVTLVLAYPLIPIVGVIGSIIGWRLRSRIAAYVLAGIGAIPLLLVVAFFVVSFVGSWLSYFAILLKH